MIQIFHLDGVYSLVGEARHLKVCPNFDRLLRQLPLDVFDENLEGLVIQAEIFEQCLFRHSLLEVVVGRALLLALRLEMPGGFSRKWGKIKS